MTKNAKKKKYQAHASAIIDKGAAIGPGTRIWHWVHVSAKSRIGADCVLGQGVYVGNDVVIGDRVKIQNGVSVYDQVTLEDGVFCGPSMVFTNVINPRAEIERKSEYLPTRVSRGATLGANCTVVCGVTIGRYAFVGAGTVVTKDVPDHALVVGVPAKQTGWMGEHGERLRKGKARGTWVCPATGAVYEACASGLRPRGRRPNRRKA